jgi:hypothetical protein
MRALADEQRIRRLMRALGRAAREPARVYFTGGATAVLLRWRETTIDVDLAFVPESDALLRALPELKNELQLNVELASPSDFIPVPARWDERSVYAGQEGDLAFLHYDLYSQALAKLERAHRQDLEDVATMVDRGLIEPARALEFFGEIEPELYRYPAVEPASFRARVVQMLG